MKPLTGPPLDYSRSGSSLATWTQAASRPAETHFPGPGQCPGDGVPSRPGASMDSGAWQPRSPGSRQEQEEHKTQTSSRGAAENRT